MIIQVQTGKPYQRFLFVRFRFSLLSVCLLLVIMVATFIWFSNLCELQKLHQSKDVKMINTIEKAKNCYRSKNKHEMFNDLKWLEDVLEAAYTPKPDKSIFFHETSCTHDGLLRLNAR